MPCDIPSGSTMLRGDLQDGRVRGLACRTGELLQLEEIFDIRFFDGLQCRRFSGIADRGKAVFYVAAVVLCAEQRVDRQHAEFRNDGLPVAGRDCHRCCCEQDCCFDAFHLSGRVVFRVKIAKMRVAVCIMKKNHSFCRKILQFSKKALSLHHKTDTVDSSKG